MPLPSTKELKKLAAACRAAGIKQLKTENFEFTLTDEVPEKRYYRTATKSEQHSQQDPKEMDMGFPTEEELIDWSSGAEGKPIV